MKVGSIKILEVKGVDRVTTRMRDVLSFNLSNTLIFIIFLLENRHYDVDFRPKSTL